jgi:endoglucanase
MGARQPIIATGLNWGNDLGSRLRYRSHDPVHQLVLGFHVYNARSCVTAACWSYIVGPVALQVPTVTTELGETGCSHEFVNSFMNWADSAGVSYLR